MNNSNIQKNVAFKAIEVQIELERNLIAVSDSNADKALKNKIARLKACDKYVKASLNALTFIANASDEKTVEELCNYKCYKTAQRILSYAEYMSNSAKIDANTSHFMSAYNALVKQYDNVTASHFSAKMTRLNDNARNNKTLKCFQFFNLISIKNKCFRDAISVDDTIYFTNK